MATHTVPHSPLLCCLCRTELLSKTQKAKKLLLFGNSASVFLSILDGIVEESTGNKFSQCAEENGLDKTKSYICHECCHGLNDYKKYSEKAKKEREKILEKVQATSSTLWPQLHEGATTAVTVDSITPTRRPAKRRRTTSMSHSTFTTPYQSGNKTYVLRSPFTEVAVKKIVRKSYRSLSSVLTNSERTSDKILNEIIKMAKKEMKYICSRRHDSILRDRHEGVKRFSWETVWQEISQHVPILTAFLMQLSKRDKSLVCVIVSMLLKKRLPKMCLIQRSMSMLLYGNATHKQVYNCLQPLMMCLSYSGTLKQVDLLAEDYDIDALYWSNSLLPYVEKNTGGVVVSHGMVLYSVASAAGGDDDDDDDGNDEAADSTAEVNVEDYLSDTDDSYVYETDHENLDEEDDVSSDASESDSSDTSFDMSATESDMEIDANAKVQTAGVCKWEGFKIVSDNIDKNIRPSFERINMDTISLHYFHSYAVLDRVDLSGVQDVRTSGVCDLSYLLPTVDDIKAMESQFNVLVSRILVTWLDEFKKSSTSIIWHMEHERQAEMSRKSEVVPLGVILLNENTIDHMCRILDQLHRYIPTETVHEERLLDNGDIHKTDDQIMHEILLGGDQLTVTRARSAIATRRTHRSRKEQLLGVVPVIEDWHARLTLMQVIFKRLMNKSSGREVGTLMHLKNLTKSKQVPNDPKENLKATEDFYLKVLIGYIIVSAKEIIKSHHCTISDVTELAELIIRKYVCLLSTPAGIDTSDQILTYSSDVITLGLLWSNFHDATKEGDGKRIMLIWKFLLIAFSRSNRTNYRKEAILLLLQYHCIFSDRKTEQLIYSRTVNTHGRIGCNIPCDLHLEHLNRRLKTVLRNLRSNVQTSSIVRAAKSIGFIQNICGEFERVTSNSNTSGCHNPPGFQKDIKLITDSLMESPAVFETSPGRKHKSFSLNHTLIEKYNKDLLEEKIAEIAGNHLMYMRS